MRDPLCLLKVISWAELQFGGARGLLLIRQQFFSAGAAVSSPSKAPTSKLLLKTMIKK